MKIKVLIWKVLLVESNCGVHRRRTRSNRCSTYCRKEREYRQLNCFYACVCGVRVKRRKLTNKTTRRIEQLGSSKKRAPSIESRLYGWITYPFPSYSWYSWPIPNYEYKKITGVHLLIYSYFVHYFIQTLIFICHKWKLLILPIFVIFVFVLKRLVTVNLILMVTRHTMTRNSSNTLNLNY